MNCYECNKKLGIIRQYRHPLDNKKIICGDCCDWILLSLKYYNNCLKNGKPKHKKECYFWDTSKNRCKNEKYIKEINYETKKRI